MTKKTRPERRLIIVSQRRQPSESGLVRLVAAMVLHQLREQHDAPPAPASDAAAATTEESAG